MLTLYDEKIEESDKQDIVTNIEFEAMVPSIKRYFFHKHMVDFLNKTELSDQKYQTNGNVRGENYKRSFSSYERLLVIWYRYPVNIFYVKNILKRQY